MADNQESKMATVQELIEHLQRFGPNLAVVVCDQDRDDEGGRYHTPLLSRDLTESVELTAFRKGGYDDQGKWNGAEDREGLYWCPDDSDQVALRAICLS